MAYLNEWGLCGDNVKCPKCGGGMALRRGARGSFIGCRAYPKCDGTRPAEYYAVPQKEHLETVRLLLREATDLSPEETKAVRVMRHWLSWLVYGDDRRQYEDD